jgi:hypothetical protein
MRLNYSSALYQKRPKKLRIALQMRYRRTIFATDGAFPQYLPPKFGYSRHRPVEVGGVVLSKRLPMKVVGIPK